MENNISARDILQANSIVIVGSLVFFTLSESIGIVSGILLIVANYLFVMSIVFALGNKLPMPQKLRHDKEKILGRSMWMFVIGLILFFLVMFILIFKQMLLNFFGL